MLGETVFVVPRAEVSTHSVSGSLFTLYALVGVPFPVVDRIGGPVDRRRVGGLRFEVFRT